MLLAIRSSDIAPGALLQAASLPACVSSCVQLPRRAFDLRSALCLPATHPPRRALLRRVVVFHVASAHREPLRRFTKSP
jgi:hypothetical protein